MIRWEYMTVDLSVVSSGLPKELNRLGAQGWEAIAAVHVPLISDVVRVFLKRPVGD